MAPIPTWTCVYQKPSHSPLIRRTTDEQEKGAGGHESPGPGGLAAGPSALQGKEISSSVSQSSSWKQRAPQGALGPFPSRRPFRWSQSSEINDAFGLGLEDFCLDMNVSFPAYYILFLAHFLNPHPRTFFHCFERDRQTDTDMRKKHRLVGCLSYSP